MFDFSTLDGVSAVTLTIVSNRNVNFSSPLVYKYETQSLKYHPKDWPADNFRSRCLVVFEISLPGHTPLLIQGASYHNIVADNRGVALPKEFVDSTKTAEGSSKGA